MTLYFIGIGFAFFYICNIEVWRERVPLGYVSFPSVIILTLVWPLTISIIIINRITGISEQLIFLGFLVFLAGLLIGGYL